MYSNATDAHMNQVSAPEIVSGMSGESEKEIREIFAEAKACAPSLIFIDEIDAITGKRENAQREVDEKWLAASATRYDALQHTATPCNALQHTATYGNTLQHTATHCNTLQNTTTHGNALQHTTTHRNAR